jgi:adenosylcobinamide kinase / adenosylcobinamide-phosphate guanylyltransferase
MTTFGGKQMSSARLILVTGGVRSGKSRFAESRLAQLAPGWPWRYIATAEPGDDEMKARIARHQARRGSRWRTVEAPRDLAAALSARDDATGILVDCITIWLSNLLLDGATDDALVTAGDAIAAAARSTQLPVVLVTNEVGSGIVPETPLGRRFRDIAGIVNQGLAAACDEVHLVVSGLPLRLR